MRLREMQNIVETELKNLTYNATNVSQGVELNKWTKFRNALINLDQLDIFNKEMDELRTFMRIEPYDDSITLTNDNYKILNANLNILRATCSTTLRILGRTLGKLHNNSLSIRIPDYNTLNELAEFTSKLSKALDQLIYPNDVDGKVELKSFDSGSIWYEVALGSSVALSLIARAVYSAAVARKQMLEGDLLKKQIESYGMKNEMISDLNRAIKAKVDAVVEMEARNLALEFDEIEKSNENIKRVEYGIKTLAELINEGTQIKPSLNTPSNISDLFPDYGKLDFIESKIQQIEGDKSS